MEDPGIRREQTHVDLIPGQSQLFDCPRMRVAQHRPEPESIPIAGLEFRANIIHIRRISMSPIMSDIIFIKSLQHVTILFNIPSRAQIHIKHGQINGHHGIIIRVNKLNQQAEWVFLWVELRAVIFLDAQGPENDAFYIVRESRDLGL